MDQGKILITEDEESLRFVLQKALETEGYWVQTAANGASARRLLTDSHFDISLMDIKLPDVDGLDLFEPPGFRSAHHRYFPQPRIRPRRAA